MVDDPEDLPDETFGRPVTHNNASARPAYADELCSGQFGAWCKHGADQ